MLRMVTAPSDTVSVTGEVETTVAGAKPEVEAMGAGLFTSGCVCCILIVAFGMPAFDPSGGSVIRAVSFFGAADCVIGSGGRLAGAGVGFRGMVGRAPSEGGFGGGLIPLVGLEGGGGTPSWEDGLGGAGTKGFGAEEGGGAISMLAGIFVVSFFGTTPAGGAVEAGLPGRLMRTVSRFNVG